MEKLSDILFEVLGLMLPTLILCLIIVEPLLYANVFLDKSILKNDFSKVLEGDIQFWTILFIVAVFYVMGNVIKVLSKFYYKLGEAVIDDTFFAILGYLYRMILYPILCLIYDKILCPIYRKTLGMICSKILCPIYKKLFEKYVKKERKKVQKKPVFTIIYVLYKWLRDTLVYKTDNYGRNFDGLYTNLAERVSITFENEEDKEKKWYLFYKKATTVINQNNINTLFYKFLSKYNSFRSIECVFFCGIIYNFFFWGSDIDFQRYFIVLGVNVVCVISFHEKFKRYWMLCGNEAIVGLDYYYRIIEPNMEGNKKNGK